MGYEVSGMKLAFGTGLLSHISRLISQYSILTTMLEPVELTEKALQEVKNIMATKNIPQGYGLRVGMKGGGCGGMSFVLGFDEQTDKDLAYKIEDITVLVEKRHTMYLVGMKVDFYEGSDARGFMFINPLKKDEEAVAE